MKYTLRFLPCVEDDAVAGYAWYEEKYSGCGDDFLRMFYTCIAEIELNPFQYPKLYLEFRRGLLHKFPYQCLQYLPYKRSHYIRHSSKDIQ